MQSVVEAALAEADRPGRVLQAAWPPMWAKLVHLIFLPVLDATRPWQLRYALGDGLLGVCRIAYRFDTIGRCLGEPAHLHTVVQSSTTLTFIISNNDRVKPLVAQSAN